MNAVFPDLELIKQRLEGRQAVTRFAPSPTGYLHLGHVVNAIYVWGLARVLDGQVILRIEDHDQQRCRPEYEQAIHEDLAWLGFSSHETFRQSDCLAEHQHDLESLRARAHVYACDCSRKDIQARASSLQGEELRYDGFCRTRKLPEHPESGLRLQLPDGEVSFHDLLAGPQTQNPSEQCGDLLLRDRHQQWTYHFGVVADDIRQGVNLIIRGQDILSSTGRQLQLGQFWEPGYAPIYLHHPLLTDATGRKLSKRDFDQDIHELMLAGEKPEKVLGKAAALAGLITEERELQQKELAGLFGK